MTYVWTKTPAEVFASVDGSGDPRGADLGETEVLITEIAEAVNELDAAIQALPGAAGISTKTAAYTLTNADKGQLMLLSGSAFYVLTVPAASGFDDDFSVTVANMDTGRCKTLTVSGYGSFRLWMGQSVTFRKAGSSWMFNLPGRYVAPSSLTLHQDATLGSDDITLSDGLGTGAGAFATIGNAVLVHQREVNHNGYQPHISLASGATFTEALVMRGGFVGAFEVFIDGDGTQTWQCGGSSACIDARDFAIAVIQGLKLQSTGSGSSGIRCSQGAVVDVGGIEFGTFAGGYGIQCYQGGSVNYVGSTYTVSGNCIAHWYIQGAGSNIVMFAGTGSLPSNITVTAFLQIVGPGYFQGSGSFSGLGSVTGKKYDITLNGAANTSGGTLPGGTAGTTGSGGQYA